MSAQYNFALPGLQHEKMPTKQSPKGENPTHYQQPPKSLRKPVAHNYGLSTGNSGLLFRTLASHFGLLGFPSTSIEDLRASGRWYGGS